jgi:phage gp36-like protein
MYITKSDLKTTLYAYQIEDITAGDNTIVEMAIAAAEEEIRSNLKAVYDIEAEFVATSKNALLVEICKDIAVWQLIKLANVDLLYDNVKGRYDRAIAWLDKVRKGQLSPSLPVYTVEPGNEEAHSKMRWGSNPKFKHSF